MSVLSHCPLVHPSSNKMSNGADDKYRHAPSAPVRLEAIQLHPRAPYLLAFSRVQSKRSVPVRVFQLMATEGFSTKNPNLSIPAHLPLAHFQPKLFDNVSFPGSLMYFEGGNLCTGNTHVYKYSVVDNNSTRKAQIRWKPASGDKSILQDAMVISQISTSSVHNASIVGKDQCNMTIQPTGLSPLVT